MNVIGLAQGGNQRILARLLLAADEAVGWGRIGIFAADATYFNSSAEMRELESASDLAVLKEWESVNAGLARKPDLARIARYEAELGPPSLRAGLLADRRIFFGRYCKVRQHYGPRFSETQQLALLTEALVRIEQLFTAIEPRLIIGFVPVTLHEYLILKIAEARNIPYLLLRSTKIDNFIAFNDRVAGLSRHVEEVLTSGSARGEHRRIARQYIKRTRASGARYEGMHEADHSLRRFNLVRALRGTAGNFRSQWRRSKGREQASDQHNANYFIEALHREFSQPLRAARARRFIEHSGRAAPYHKLADVGPYCFFPLHFEPEIALQIYARPLQNQIEVARSLALSLPCGMKLVVKEHPRAAGFRPLGYYKRLLEIPNVLLAGAEEPSHSYVHHAAIVAVITGNIGLEASVMGKPVIVLGETEISALPRSMVCTSHDHFRLSGDITELLARYRYDENAIENYVSALVAGGVPVDLYSTLLGKGGRHSYGSGELEEDLARLVIYFGHRLEQVQEKESL